MAHTVTITLSRIVTAAALLAATLLPAAPAGASDPPRPGGQESAPAPAPAPSTVGSDSGTGGGGPRALPRTVPAWLPHRDQEGAYQDALRPVGQLHTVSPFWYEAISAGRIDVHPGAGERRIIDGPHRAGTEVVPTVMETMKSGALAAIPTSPARRCCAATAYATRPCGP
ncbi:hypothetical protein OHA98_15715 [Streptomyces sp. NBC_00654]|uniref:hypothetical protein n=1 Tax=Streptomyces sp. NBC_00654 TaxID=2975799 RepID=UPI00224D7CE7|nr:hypothetical protein [Streptomyces sp. NBC_00654]MCX4966258.1 hypothetical protein [Streptomyces sp. NBC_00654]